MSLQLILIVIIALVAILSQLGGRLSAKNSLAWWGTSALLLVATIDPRLFKPLAALLGIEVVSNFVLASMIFFLFFQAMEAQAATTQQTTKLRELVTSLAADELIKAPRPAEGQARPRTLIMLPCFNEEENLENTIAQIEALRASRPGEFDFCFVNDCSRDGSEALLTRRVPGHFVSHRCNLGVSGVLLTGFKIANRLGYDYVVQCDADGQHPVHEIPRLVELARQQKIDLTIGSRFGGKDLVVSQAEQNMQSTTRLRRAGGLTIRATLALFGPKAIVNDPTSGFRVYSRRAATILQGRMPEEYPEPESIAILASVGVGIREVHVAMLPRMAGTSSLAGLKSIRFMTKVVSAILGLRIRTLFLKNQVSGR